MIAKDKIYHFIAGFIITGIFALASGSVAYSVLVGVLAGIAKELYDYYDYGVYDFFDMFATFVGVFVGGAVVVTIL